MADPLALPQQEGWGTAEIQRLALMPQPVAQIQPSWSSGVLAEYALPAELQTSLPSIEAIEQALAHEAAHQPP
jgi:hypothetical protein